MLTLVVGDDFRFSYILTDENGSPLDLSAYTIRCALADESKSVYLEGTVTPIGGGAVTVFFPAVLTAQLQPHKRYYMDFGLVHNATGEKRHLPVPPLVVWALPATTRI